MKRRPSRTNGSSDIVDFPPDKSLAWRQHPKYHSPMDNDNQLLRVDQHSLRLEVQLQTYVQQKQLWNVWKLCLVSTIPLPFFRSVAIPLPLRVRTEMLETSFRIHRDEVSRTLIGCPSTAERKNTIRSCCYGTAVTAQRQVATATAQRNFSRRQRTSYSAYVILTEFA